MSTLKVNPYILSIIKKKQKSKVPGLGKCPFKMGTVRKVFIEKPKKT